MATKQIKDLTVATTIEDTDSIPLQTLSGVTKKFTPAELKTNLDGRYQQFGTPIWDSTTGETNITTLTLTAGHIYEVWIGDSANVFCIRIRSGSSFNFWYHNMFDLAIGFGLITFNNTGGYTVSYTDETLTTPSTSNDARIYKITDMGVLNLSEV